MSVFKIEELYDHYECDDCGTSYATGFIVYQDDAKIIDMSPYAHCYNGTHYQMADVLKNILEHLGHTLEDY